MATSVARFPAELPPADAHHVARPFPGAPSGAGRVEIEVLDPVFGVGAGAHLQAARAPAIG